MTSLYPTVIATAAKRGDPTDPMGGTYRRPLRDDPSTLDPGRASDIYSYTVVNQLFDGLVQFDNHLNPIPAIAGFWEASPNGLTWTFYLRKGVTFHHGREVIAEDFVYSFTRLLDPAIKSPAAGYFKYIRGAKAFRNGVASHVDGLKALDRYILQIALDKPYTPLLSILAMANAKVVPHEEVDRLGKQFGQHPIGSGPFTFEQWQRNQSITLNAYDHYHAGRPFLNRIVFRVGQQDDQSLKAFLEGQLEESMVPSSKLGDLDNPRYRRYTHLRKPTLHLLYIGFNTRKTPFTNPKVRQAFNYAINKNAIVREIRKGNSNVAKGILPPGMPGYDPSIEGYYYSPKQAKQLLAEAGYPKGKGLPTIDLWYSTKEETAPREMIAYQTDLAAVGVTVTLHRAKNWPTFKALLTEGKPLMFRLGWHSDIPDPDNFFFPLLYSQSRTNRTFYHNPQLDPMLEAARRETDYLQRIKLYRDIERRALKDANWISQHHRVFESLYQPYVRGVEINSLGAQYIPMKKIWLLKNANIKTAKE
ncbi:MAG: ABC transporter substrate-binding protein [Candidatus Tectomicrobia bacterium]|nr:ABC transporter substrate-binding protein [Candidatus Tectomicrobia bacterium]